jgi:hypothetical protein
MTANEKAQAGVNYLKAAILELLSAHPEGLRNVEIAEALGLQSDFEGDQKDYLSWSLLGILVNEGKVRYGKVGRYRRYFAQE